MAVEANKAKEGSDFGDGGGKGPVEDGFDLFRVHGDTISRYLVAKENGGGLGKVALGWFEMKPCVGERLKNKVDVFKVFGFGSTVHHDVVEVH